mgnify:CR=1 FL=1
MIIDIMIKYLILKKEVLRHKKIKLFKYFVELLLKKICKYYKIEI